MPEQCTAISLGRHDRFLWKFCKGYQTGRWVRFIVVQCLSWENTVSHLLRCCTYLFSSLSLFELNFDMLRLRWYNYYLRNVCFLGSYAKIQICFCTAECRRILSRPTQGNCCLVEMKILNKSHGDYTLDHNKVMYFATCKSPSWAEVPNLGKLVCKVMQQLGSSSLPIHPCHAGQSSLPAA